MEQNSSDMFQKIGQEMMDLSYKKISTRHQAKIFKMVRMVRFLFDPEAHW